MDEQVWDDKNVDTRRTTPPSAQPTDDAARAV